jgi:hypothetical protein
VVCSPDLFLCFQGREGDQEDIALTAYVVGVFLEVGLNASVWILIISGLPLLDAP